MRLRVGRAEGKLKVLTGEFDFARNELSLRNARIEELSLALGISPRTAKAHCDRQTLVEDRL